MGITARLVRVSGSEYGEDLGYAILVDDRMGLDYDWMTSTAFKMYPTIQDIIKSGLEDYYLLDSIVNNSTSRLSVTEEEPEDILYIGFKPFYAAGGVKFADSKNNP